MTSISITDLLIIGGGPAGISAANFFARLNRPFIMYDSGLYRNEQSPAAHTIINFDGVSPSIWRDSAIRELEAKYGSGEGMGTLQYRQDKIVSLVKDSSIRPNITGFKAIDASGRTIHSRKVVLATGIRDVLPDIPGLQEAWGKRAIHCIFCHGTETAKQPFAFLLNPGNPFNSMMAPSIVKMWYTLEHSKRYILTNGADPETEEGLKASGLGTILGLVKARGYIIIPSKISSVTSHPTHLSITFANSAQPDLEIPHMLVIPDKNIPSDHASQLLSHELLGSELTTFGTIPALMKDGKPVPMPMSGMGDNPKTNVPGLFWAGNAGSFAANVAMSVAQGMNAGVVAGDELGQEDMEQMMKEM